MMECSHGPIYFSHPQIAQHNRNPTNTLTHLFTSSNFSTPDTFFSNKINNPFMINAKENIKWTAIIKAVIQPNTEIVASNVFPFT